MSPAFLSGLHVAFAPAIPLQVLAALAVAAVLVTLYSLVMGARGALARGLAFAILLAWLAGPLLVREKHAPLPDVAVIVTDRSQSMSIGERAHQAEGARLAMKKALALQPNLIVRETSIATTATGEDNGTQAFAALNAAIADVRRAGLRAPSSSPMAKCMMRLPPKA